MICELGRQEADFFNKKYEVAAPFELVCDNDGVRINVYPSVRPVAEEFLRLFGDGDSLFSNESVLWLCERLGAYLDAHGFELSPDSEAYYVKYLLTSPPEASSDAVKRLTGAEAYDDLTETDIDGLISDGYIIYAAVEDGCIAAVANTGEPVNGEPPREIEIGVDTAEKYRRKGFGKACAGALAHELIAMGHTVSYECASDNKASVALIESLGGQITAKKIYIVGFIAE